MHYNFPLCLYLFKSTDYNSKWQRQQFTLGKLLIRHFYLIYPTSLAHYDQGLIEFRGKLTGLAGGTSAASREAITNKNHVIYEGVTLGAVGIFASAMAIIKSEESVQEGKQKQESNVTEWDRARGIIARGPKLAAAIMGGLVYTSTKS